MSEISLQDPKSLYQEISTLNGVKGNTQEKRNTAYRLLGHRQTLCRASEDFDCIIALRMSISEHIQQTHSTHVGFDLPSLTSPTTVFVDEAQLLTLAELKLLEKISLKQLFLCMDTNQSIFSNISIRSLFIQRCHELNTPLSIHDFPISYRNSINVSHAANQILLLKSHFCGATDKHELQTIESNNQSDGAVFC